MPVSLEKHGPWALIVGGSEGVGAAFADILAGQGFNLVLTSYLKEPLDEVVADLKARYAVDIRALVHDLLTDDPLGPARKLTDGLEVGLLVYTAGSIVPGPSFVESPVEHGLKSIKLNCIGHTVYSHHYGRSMKERGRGGIILVGSNAGVSGLAGLTCYAAAKAYSRVFAEGLWAELKPHGVDVLGLHPGPIRSPFMARLGVDVDDPNLGAANPQDIASEGIAQLGEGPTHFACGSDYILTQIEGKSRAEAVEIASAVASGKGLEDSLAGADLS